MATAKAYERRVHWVANETERNEAKETHGEGHPKDTGGTSSSGMSRQEKQAERQRRDILIPEDDDGDLTMQDDEEEKALNGSVSGKGCQRRKNSQQSHLSQERRLGNQSRPETCRHNH